jgi:hypothetical protein
MQHFVANEKKPGEKTAKRIITLVIIAKKVTEALLIL